MKRKSASVGGAARTLRRCFDYVEKQRQSEGIKGLKSAALLYRRRRGVPHNAAGL